jgi:hypothetical protein
MDRRLRATTRRRVSDHSTSNTPAV